MLANSLFYFKFKAVFYWFILHKYFDAFSLFSHVADAYIMRLPCLTYANFSIVKPGHILSEDVLETYNDLIEEECEAKCIEHRLCKSINTKSSTGENCQLSSKSTEDPFDNAKLSASAEWTYKTTDHKARNVITID